MKPEVDFLVEQDVRTLVRWFKRGEWVKDIHDWYINPAHVVSVRLKK